MIGSVQLLPMLQNCGGERKREAARAAEAGRQYRHQQTFYELLREELQRRVDSRTHDGSSSERRATHTMVISMSRVQCRGEG